MKRVVRLASCAIVLSTAPQVASAQSIAVFAQSQTRGVRGPGIDNPVEGQPTFFLFGANNEGAPVLADNGDIFFNAEFGAAGFGGSRAMFRWRAGANTPIIRNNDPINFPTGVAGAESFTLRFNPFNPPAINESQPYPAADGSVAFYSQAGINTFGVWKRSSAGVITPIVITGSDGPLGPGLGPGVTLSTIGSSRLVHSNGGEVSINAASFSPSTVDMILSSDPSLVRRLVAFRNGVAPIAGKTYVSVGFPLVSTVGSSEILHFAGGLSGFPNASLVTRGPAAAPAAVALSGSDGALGPGLGAGSFYFDSQSSFNVLGASAAGTVVLTEVSPFLLPSYRGVVRVSQSGEHVLVARSYPPEAAGPQGPGFGPTVNFLGFTNVVMNDAGAIVFAGVLTGSTVTSANDFGIFVVGPSQTAPTCIARNGATSGPLAPPIAGYTWAFSSFSPGDFQFAMNQSGEIVFAVAVRDPSLNIRQALLRWSPGRGLEPLVLTGATSFDADLDGSVRNWTITNFGFNGNSGGNDGRNSGLGDNGTIVISAGVQAQDPPRSFATLLRLGGAPACDDIDFNNNDVFPEDQDVIDFFNVLAGGDCSPGNTCNDIDFNNNGVFPEDQDVIDFFNVLAGAECS